MQAANLSSPPRQTLSVVVIAKNEAHNIGDCLGSVQGLADEILVFDSGSTDDTPEICRRLGAQVFETDWPGFGAQYNRALAAARCDWTFLLDADEQASEALRVEILNLLKIGSPHTAFEIPVIRLFCGRPMRWGGYKPGYVQRFFKTGTCHFDKKLVHNRLLFKGSCGQFQSLMMHHTAPDLSTALEKMDRYSTLSAHQKQAEGQSSGLTKAVLYGLWVFIRHYLFQLGFLDGRLGFIAALTKAEYVYYRGVKLMLLAAHRLCRTP